MEFLKVWSELLWLLLKRLLGSGMPRRERALTKRRWSPSRSLICGMMVLTSWKVESFSKMGIRWRSSRSFLSSYQEVQGIAFSGWKSELSGELSIMITSARDLPNFDRSLTYRPLWKVQWSLKRWAAATLCLSILWKRGSAYSGMLAVNRTTSYHSLTLYINSSQNGLFTQ